MAGDDCARPPDRVKCKVVKTQLLPSTITANVVTAARSDGVGGDKGPPQRPVCYRAAWCWLLRNNNNGHCFAMQGDGDGRWMMDDCANLITAKLNADVGGLICFGVCCFQL